MPLFPAESRRSLREVALYWIETEADSMPVVGHSPLPEAPRIIEVGSAWPTSSQHPRRAINARRQLRCLGIADDYFLRRVPFNFASDHHGNKAEMAGQSGMMGGFDRGNRWFA